MLEDERLDHLINRHLSKQLDPQLGRAVSRFDAEVMHRSDRLGVWPRRLGWVSVAAAACLAVAWTWQSLHHTAQQRLIPAVPEIVQGPQSPQLIPVSESIAWRTIDDGVVGVEDDVPIRQIRNQFLQTIEWYDPDRKATVEMTVPREEIVFVALNSH